MKQNLSKNHVIALGICMIGSICITGIIMGRNGTLIALSYTAIGAMLGMLIPLPKRRLNDKDEEEDKDTE